jgi:hypothetical protein
MFTVFVEIAIALLFIFFFITSTKPKVFYLFLGFFFFLVNVVIQMPFKYVYAAIEPYFAEASTIPLLIIAAVTIIISILTKYFSLKRFLKTKSYRNGILFGMGWATFESISLFTIIFFEWIFSVTQISFDYSYALAQNMPILSFIFMFITGIATTVFIVIGIIREKGIYLVMAMLFQAFIVIGINYLTIFTTEFLMIVTFIVSLFVIFSFKKLTVV